MTEKRFYCKKDGNNQWTVSDRLNQYPMPITSLEFCSVVANALNRLWDKVIRFEKYSQEHLERANKLEEENEQLQERNNRQAKQLDNIYHLIEQRDWRALSDIIDDFKKAEEQLQSEWKCYE